MLWSRAASPWPTYTPLAFDNETRSFLHFQNENIDNMDKKGKKSNLAIAKNAILMSFNCLKFSNAISVDARLARLGRYDQI